MPPLQMGATPAGALAGAASSTAHTIGLKHQPRRDVSSSTHRSQSERSLAFKRWAHGRCYRCLARDHQVSSYTGPFCCISCRRPGHRERHCRFRSPSPSPQGHASGQVHHSSQSRSWADVVASSSPSGHTSPSQANITKVRYPPQGEPLSHEKNAVHACHSCCCHASPSSTPLDVETLVTPLLESLRSELKELIAIRLEEVVRPLREEASTIKLWLARVAKYLERVERQVEHSSPSDMAELFGPCSPVQRSPTPSILTSLAAALTPASSLLCEVTSVDTARSITEEMAANTPATKNCSEKGIVTPEVTTRTIPIEQHIVASTTTSIAETHIYPPTEQVLSQVAIPDEDVVLVEDASDDEEVLSDVLQAVEDPIPLVTVEDDSIQPAVAVKTQQQTDEPALEAAFSLDVTTMKVEDSVCPPVHPPSPPTNTTRHQRKSYDRSSLRRSARLAQSKVLKDLSIMGNDGSLDEDRIKGYADCLKQLLPPDLLMSLMSLKDRDFWDVVARIPLTLR